eukprot:10696016-Ditylum_brightwellii.AAC.1
MEKPGYIMVSPGRFLDNIGGSKCLNSIDIVTSVESNKDKKYVNRSLHLKDEVNVEVPRQKEKEHSEKGRNNKTIQLPIKMLVLVKCAPSSKLQYD